MKILRAVGILALVATLVIGGAGSVFAQGPPDSQGKPHGLFGEVSDVDEGAKTFTLTTRKGDEVHVTATPDTRYKVPGIPPSDNINTINIDSPWVAMNGTWEGENFCPKKVHVVPGQGLNFHFVGTVKAYDVGQITVDCKKVGFVDFTVNGLTDYRPDETTLEDITNLVDSEIYPTVTVVASGWDADATPSTAMAKAIVLHDAEPESDTTPPYTSGHDPAKDDTDVPIGTNIVVHVQDDGDGVDQATISMTVAGSLVDPTDLTITGTVADYTLTYDPPSDFAYETLVEVIVEADDLAGNPMTDSYSFTTEEED